MSFIEQLEALERLHLLIKRKATGTPEELAQLFQVSYSTIKNLLRILRHKGFPISYCRHQQTYYYDYEVEVSFFMVKPQKEKKRER
jgi:predicted DNA-binding transcriptional regulator YafY